MLAPSSLGSHAHRVIDDHLHVAIGLDPDVLLPLDIARDDVVDAAHARGDELARDDVDGGADALLDIGFKPDIAQAKKLLTEAGYAAGFKLVAGRRGARQWGSEAEVLELFKSFRMTKDEMYELKLISPAGAEKLLKSQPKRWTKVAPLITQSEGKPTVDPVTKRPIMSVMLHRNWWSWTTAKKTIGEFSVTVPVVRMTNEQSSPALREYIAGFIAAQTA